MYCHPHAVKKCAKAMKPKATPAQIEQARIMRAARVAKRIFLERQLPIFESDASSMRRPTTIPPSGESAPGRPPAFRKEMK